MTFFRTIAGFLLCGLVAVPAAAEVWSPWADLAKLRPDGAKLIAERTGRGHAEKQYTIQRIAKGWGSAVNFDEYAVAIDKFPNGWNSEQFFAHVRVHLNEFLDQNVSPLRPFSDGDKGDWQAGTDAKLGTIMVFEIRTIGPAFDDGAVVVSRTGKFTWTFSPIEDGLLGSFGTHPVAGNRQFGLREVSGKTQFYTRALDRVYPLEIATGFEGSAFEGADKLWQGLQSKLVAYVNVHGGSATALAPNVPGGNDPAKKPQYTAVCADAAMELSC